MASKFAAIREHVRATIATYATVKSCEDNWLSERLDLPAAFIGWGKCSYHVSSGNAELMVYLPFTVEVVGGDLESVQVALEQIDGMWIFSTPRLAALHAAGGATIKPEAALYPMSEGEANIVRGSVDLVLQIIRSS